LPRVLDETDAAMVKEQVPIYQKVGHIVQAIRLDNDSNVDGIKRKAGSLQITDVQRPRLRELMIKHIDFQIMTKDGPYSTPAPAMVAAHYMARGGTWGLRTLIGIIENPTIRPDGSVLTQPGYDRDTGLFFDPNGLTFPEIPERPTKQQAEAALELLKRPIREFPFETEADRGVLLSAIVTAPIRHALRSAPMVSTDSSTPGTGKTLAANIPAMVLTGRPAAVMSQGANDEEDEKRLAGVLWRGDNFLIIDNVRRPIIGPDCLCSMISEETAQIRILGSTGQIHVPCHVLVMATGNNIQFAGDMVRRVIISRLDAKLERPEERVGFELDLKTWVPEHRAELVAAALTIVRWFIVEGPAPSKDFKSSGFDDWDARVRRPLMALGCPDPWLTNARIGADDSVTGSLGAVLRVVHDLITTTEFTPGEVATMATEGTELFKVLCNVLPKGVISASTVGWFLRRNEGRIVNGLRFKRTLDVHTKNFTTRIEEIKPLAKVPEQGTML
jgi:hypothetical protein